MNTTQTTTTTARDIIPGSILVTKRAACDVAEVRLAPNPWEPADRAPRAQLYDYTGRRVASYAPDELVRVIPPAAPVTIIR